MALIKLTAIVDNISGKLNGTVFARNKGGHYMRSKSNPVNPRTDKQVGVRAAFAVISSLWSALTAGQRQAWNTIAVDYPYQNRLGDTKVLSGFALHQKLNRNLQLIEAASLSSPLAPATTPAVDELVLATSKVLSIELQGKLPQGSTADSTLLVYATPAISAGTANFQNKLRLLGKFAGAGVGAGIEIITAYEAVFDTPVLGTNIGYQVVTINNKTGQASAPVITSGIIMPA